MQSADFLALFSQSSGDVEVTESKLETVLSALDSNVCGMFQELFVKLGCFELGLEFCDFCQKEIDDNRDKIEDWKYIIYREYLICLRLNMLDQLDEWDEYILFTDWALSDVKTPYTGNGESNDDKYLYIDSDGKTQTHFLWSWNEKTRYEVIGRKIARRDSGKSIEHLKRQQRYELSPEDIEQRYNIILYFFKGLTR